MDSKPCLQCGKSFYTPGMRRTQKYCSLACYYASRPRVTRTCGHCGEQFQAGGRTYKSKTAQFCSRQCSSAARYADYVRPVYTRPPDELKPCAHCQELKPPQNFTKDKTRLDSLSAYCQICSRALRTEAHRKFMSTEAGRKSRRRKSWLGVLKSYGLTEDDYDALKSAQDGLCAICRCPEKSRNPDGLRPLCVDHDHDTGQVRGLLCHSCNVALGHFREDPERLMAALRYLSKG